jgi:hypothetical protein
MKKISITLLLTIFALTMMAQEQDSVKSIAPSNRSYFGIALGASASTNGFGGNITTALSKRFALRLGYEKVDMTFKDAFKITQEGYTFNTTPTWKAGGFSAIMDFYLFSGLYISGGVVLSDMNLSAELNPGDGIKIGDITFEPNELGGLKLAIKPENKVAPYAALGFGRNISRNHRLAMSFEMGAYYTGSYVVDLSGTNLFESNNSNKSIDALNKTLKEISWSGIYPIIKLGISYKFIGKNR